MKCALDLSREISEAKRRRDSIFTEKAVVLHFETKRGNSSAENDLSSWPSCAAGEIQLLPSGRRTSGADGGVYFPLNFCTLVAASSSLGPCKSWSTELSRDSREIELG